MILVSIIIPCYNAASKIGKCLASLENIDFPKECYEIVFVDDCSTDNTFSLLQEECKYKKNWYAYQLDKNSRSPSKPRNEGVKKAKGEYIFYLDCDDEILPDTLLVHFQHAKKTNACIVRGNLIADNGKQQKEMNTISNWNSSLPKKNKIELLISKQSTTAPQLIKRKLLIENSINWPEDIRMGEDTIFLANVLSCAENIEYVHHNTFIYNKMPTLSLSTTQSYGDKDLRDHLSGWELVQRKLEEVGVNYIKLRLTIGLQTVLKSLIFKNRHDIESETFNNFTNFIRKYYEVIKSFKLSLRYLEIIQSIYNNDFEGFDKLCRPRMLIAGHDLKFILPIEKKISKYFDIRYDKWVSHTEHNEDQSLKLLDWAEIIWCEWMLGNSVWYSEHKKSQQKLVIRMHRQELATDYADNIDFNRVDLVFAVSALFFERLLERFPNIPRNKVRLLSNYVDVESYEKKWDNERLFNLAMIGILPSRKNFKEALKIIHKLKDIDNRYTLTIYGKVAKDLPWVMRIKEEKVYFEQCDKYIEEYNLTPYIKYKGHCDLKKSLSDDKIGYVLSLSEADLILPESFHLAVADGFSGGGISLIRKWPGCEYIFPDFMIKNSLTDIVDFIVDLNNKGRNDFIELSAKGQNFISVKYSEENFLNTVKKEISSL